MSSSSVVVMRRDALLAVAAASSSQTLAVAQPSDASPTAKKLSTERSRLCRQRQKNYALNLEDSVRALRTELADLQALHALRCEQTLHTRSFPTSSLARLVSEYYDVFAHGLAPEAPASRKRSLTARRALSPQQQREFMYSIMDPHVQVFDWVGRMAVGCQPLLNGWESWVLWHASYLFRVESMDVVDVHGLLAVRTNSTITVTVSEKTLEFFFPLAASDARLRAKLLGKQIVYSLRDTFFFSATGRVVKYTVDLDFIGALMKLMGNYADVLALVAPFNDLAIQSPKAPLVKGSRHAVAYLLS
jgi:hypothetical protein